MSRYPLNMDLITYLNYNIGKKAGPNTAMVAGAGAKAFIGKNGQIVVRKPTSSYGAYSKESRKANGRAAGSRASGCKGKKGAEFYSCMRK